jgi:uncharacterized protein with PQ loop repeat
MQELFLTALPYLYQSIAVVAAIGYLPQILSLLRAKTPSLDISLTTWWIWFSTWVVSLVYGIVFIKDVRFITIACVNLAGHVGVIGLTVYNRYYRFKA